MRIRMKIKNEREKTKERKRKTEKRERNQNHKFEAEGTFISIRIGRLTMPLTEDELSLTEDETHTPMSLVVWTVYQYAISLDKYNQVDP